MAVSTKNKKYSLEYPIKSSPGILWEFLATPSGLAEWFAEDVNQRNNQFTFVWEGNVQKAKILEQVENIFIRFRWEESPKDEYVEFRIAITDVTGDTVLHITDFANPKEMADSQKLWDSQVHDLKKRLGGGL